MKESLPEYKANLQSTERSAHEQERLSADWSESQRKAVVIALALHMRKAAEGGGDPYYTLSASSEVILQVLTEDADFLQSNRQVILQGLDESQIQRFRDELEASPSD